MVPNPSNASFSQALLVPDCDKAFTQQGNMERHVKAVHNKENPFSCPESDCDKPFAAKQTMEKHFIRLHITERPFKFEPDVRRHAESDATIQARILHPFKVPLQRIHRNDLAWPQLPNTAALDPLLKYLNQNPLPIPIILTLMMMTRRTLPYLILKRIRCSLISLLNRIRASRNASIYDLCSNLRMDVGFASEQHAIDWFLQLLCDGRVRATLAS